MTVTELVGQPLAAVGIEVPFESVEVGDVVLFGAYSVFSPEVVDADTVVKVDEKGAHFAGGTYLAAVDEGGKATVVVAKQSYWKVAA